MLAELRAKSQVTIPKEVVTRLGIKEGDKLEITEKDGVIQLIPVVVYPKKYVDELKSEIDGIKGVTFAVWAPDAQRVSVIGDFNTWDGRRHPMRLRRECGVYLTLC